LRVLGTTESDGRACLEHRRRNEPSAATAYVSEEVVNERRIDALDGPAPTSVPASGDD
jgi:hypothetical protein